MEFNEKLQELRKQKGLTQEELAQALFVSRTAVSKWESNRGYPSIDSLKAIAKFFSVTIDELLSGDEMLTIAEEDSRQKHMQFCDIVFGLLDCSAAMFFFLPLFAQRMDGVVYEASLLSLNTSVPYLKMIFLAVTIGIVFWGVMTLALQNCSNEMWQKIKNKISLLLNITGVVLFIISFQPYAAVMLFIFLLIKALISAKKR